VERRCGSGEEVWEWRGGVGVERRSGSGEEWDGVVVIGGGGRDGDLG